MKFGTRETEQSHGRGTQLGVNFSGTGWIVGACKKSRISEGAEERGERGRSKKKRCRRLVEFAREVHKNRSQRRKQIS